MNQENNKIKRTQIVLNVPLELKGQVKAAAALRNIFFSTWIIRAIRKELRATMENPIKVCKCFEDDK